MRAVPPRDASTHPAPIICVTMAMTARLIRATSLADAIALPFQTVVGMAFAKQAKAPAAPQTATQGLSRSEGSNAPLVSANRRGDMGEVVANVKWDAGGDNTDEKLNETNCAGPESGLDEGSWMITSTLTRA